MPSEAQRKSSEHLSRRWHAFGSVVLLLAAGILLFLAESAFWVNRTVFDQATFTNITTTALLSQSSRDALATAIVDKALADRPVLQRTVGDRATRLVSSLLGSDLSNQAVTALSNRTYAYVTAANRQDIKLDLTAVKAPVSKIVDLVEDSGREVNIDPNRIPDEIVLISSATFPDLSGTVQRMLWLGPLLWFGMLAAFTAYIYIGRRDYARRVYFACLTVAIVAVIGLLLYPFVPPPVAAAVPNIELRPVVTNLTSGFLAPFKTQMWWLLGIAAVVALLFNQRFNFLKLVRSLESKLSRSMNKSGEN